MLQQIYTTSLTKKELDTLIYLTQIQDDFGFIVNVHWNEIANQIGMVAQSFYDAIYGLESKGFLSMSNSYLDGTRNFRGMHTIRLLVPTAPKEVLHQDGVVNEAQLTPHQDEVISEAQPTLSQDGIISEAQPVLSQDSVVSETHHASPQNSVVSEAQLMLPQDAIVDKAKLTLPQNGVISETQLREYIKRCGTYLNMKNYSLVNTATFRHLRVNTKKIILNLLWRHQGTSVLYGRKDIKSRDIRLTLETAASLLGFDWQRGRKGQGVRRNIKRYFEDIISSKLLPVTLDEDYTLHWSLDDTGKELPNQPIHADTPDSITDSIADICNHRTINTILNIKKIWAAPQDMQDTLKLFDEQFRSVSGLKMLAFAVKSIVTDCISRCAALVPAFINAKCRELLRLVAAKKENRQMKGINANVQDLRPRIQKISRL